MDYPLTDIPEINVLKTPPQRQYTEQAGIDLNLELILVPGGTFEMGGQDTEVHEEEKPVHLVTLKSFYIGKYPVTQAQYKKVMDNANPSERKGENYPVTNVTWDEAVTFCQKLSKLTGKTCRLPTEAEWEYAARGGKYSKGFKYAGSDSIGEVAWYGSNHNGGVRAVDENEKNMKPNELGLRHFSGNVWEWCQDWYDAKYYSISPERNPVGPDSGSSRVLRGGSWNDYPQSCRVSLRYFIAPDLRSINLGFRLVFVP